VPICNSRDGGQNTWHANVSGARSAVGQETIGSAQLAGSGPARHSGASEIENGVMRGTWFLLVPGAMLLALCSTRAAAADPGRGDPAARLSTAPHATEYWEITAHLDGGYRLLTRIGITNEGPGERTAGAIWYLIHPNGRVSRLTNGRAQGNWKLSRDHLRLDIASTTLDLASPVRRLAIDSTSQHAKIDLRFPADGIPASSPDGAFAIDALQLAAPVEGSIWVRELPAPIAVRGALALTHAWTADSLPQVVQRQIELIADQPAGLAWYLSDAVTPDGDSHRWLVVQRGGRTIYQTAALELLLGRANPAISNEAYGVPGQLMIRDDRIAVDVRLERLLLRANPLEFVPQPFRLLFELEIAPQWIWADASFHLSFSGGAEEMPVDADGHCVVAVNFMNSLRLPQ
jgi:hypothetical protein